jgi:hypothetical protein
VNAEPLCHIFYFLRANLPASFHHEIFGPCARWHDLELPIQVLEPTTLYNLIYPTHLAAVETDVRIFIHGSPYHLLQPCRPLQGHVPFSQQTIRLPEIDAALTFYRDLLGFRITDFMGPPVSLYFMHVNSDTTAWLLRKGQATACTI